MLLEIRDLDISERDPQTLQHGPPGRTDSEIYPVLYRVRGDDHGSNISESCLDYDAAEDDAGEQLYFQSEAGGKLNRIRI